MLYGKIENNDVVLPLLKESELRNAMPDTVLPAVLTNDVLLPLGYVALEAPWCPPELKQTYDKQLFYDVEPWEGLFRRVVKLVELPADVALERKKRKRAELVVYANKVLNDTAKFEAPGQYYLLGEWQAFRTAIRGILADYEADPFLVRFPERPIDHVTATDLEGKKKYALALNKARYLKQLNTKTTAECVLGFPVDVSSAELTILENAKSLGVTTFRDADNVFHEIVLEDWDTIISTIRAALAGVVYTKWTTETDIEAATEETIDAIIAGLRA